jgi:hypothetical protein
MSQGVAENRPVNLPQISNDPWFPERPDMQPGDQSSTADYDQWLQRHGMNWGKSQGYCSLDVYATRNHRHGECAVAVAGSARCAVSDPGSGPTGRQTRMTQSRRMAARYLRVRLGIPIQSGIIR